MDDAVPLPEVAAIYAGSMVVLLALLSSARQRALYSSMYILAPVIRLLLLCGIAGWVAVVWAMASGRASTHSEQVLVLTAFSLGAIAEVNQELQLCNLEWNYDLFGAVAWANLIATHREAQQVEHHLAVASATELGAEVRSMYVRLVASPSIALPPSWLRVIYYFFQQQKRFMEEADVASTPGSTRSGPGPHPTTGAAPVAVAHEAHGRGSRVYARFVSSLRVCRILLGSWNPRSVFFSVTRGSLLIPALPLFFVSACSLALQYLRAYYTLSYKVEPRLAHHMARSWLWNSLLGPPTLFPVCSAWSLWMLAAAVSESRAAELIRAMTCPPGTPVAFWSMANGRAALGNTCGAGRYLPGRPRRSKTWQVVARIIFLPMNRWRRGFPSSRELYFKFVLTALNLRSARPDGKLVPTDLCTLDDAINGNVAALSQLYMRLGGEVYQRWVEVEGHLVATGVIGPAGSVSDNGAPPHPPGGRDVEEGRPAAAGSGCNDKDAPSPDPLAGLCGAASPGGSASPAASVSSGEVPPGAAQRPPGG